MWPVPDPPLNHHRCVAQAFLPAVSQTSRSAGLVPVAKAAGLAEGWAGLKTRVTPVATGGDINRVGVPQGREVHPNARPSEGGTSKGARSRKSKIIAGIINSPVLKCTWRYGSNLPPNPSTLGPRVPILPGCAHWRQQTERHRPPLFPDNG